MSNEKDIGLEDVAILDFVDDTDEGKNEKPKAEKKLEEKLERVTSFPWKAVSHVLIGPSGVSLVPVGTTQKYTKPVADTYQTYPTPGLAPTVVEYDLNQLIGSVNAASDLEKELANTRAELDKVRAELAEAKKMKDEMPPEKPKDEKEKEVPEDEKMAKPAPTEDKPKEEDTPAECSELPIEKSKEEIAKEEKKDAALKEDEKAEKKEADHEDNLGTALRLMKVAKERNQL